MKRNITILLLLSLFLAFGFVKILDSYVDSGVVIQFDRDIFYFSQTFRSPTLDAIMLFVTLMGNWQIIIFSTALATILLYLANKERYLQVLLLSVATGLFFTEAMKVLVSRPRPPIETALMIQNGYAFPSAHSYFAVAFYGLITYFWVKHFKQIKYRILVLVLGIGCCVFIGLSRIYLGVHWASDVLAGLMSSGAWLMVVIAYMEYKSHYLHKENKEFNKRLVWRGFWGFTMLWLLAVWLLFLAKR